MLSSFLDGHFSPTKPRNHRVTKKPDWEENDGRAPDTADRLKKINPNFPKLPAVHATSPLDQAKRGKQLSSYPWDAPNSCFFDTGMELWFRCYSLWSTAAREDFLRTLTPNSALATVFHHFSRRLKCIEDPKKLQTQLQQELSFGQTLTRNLIFEKFELHTPGEYACPTSWLIRTVKVGSIE